MVTLGNLTSLLLSSRVQPDDSVSAQTLAIVDMSPPLPLCSAALHCTAYVSLQPLRSALCVCPVPCCAVLSNQITRCLYTQFKKISLHTPLSKLSEIFDHDHFALVVTSQRCFDKGGAVSEKLVVFGIVTRIDLLNFIVTHRPRGASVSGDTSDGTRTATTAAATSTTATTAEAATQFEHEHKESTAQHEEKKEASSVYSIERM